jgi:hypothetical protein
LQAAFIRHIKAEGLYYTPFSNRDLAELLRGTNRYTEAEPLMRRNLATFLDFERKTGRPRESGDPGEGC